jgi:hypothetical protein
MVLTASTRAISRYCSKIGWRKIRYFQLVSSNNRIQRFNYACCAKIYHEKYDDSSECIHSKLKNKF